MIFSIISDYIHIIRKRLLCVFLGTFIRHFCLYLQKIKLYKESK